MTVNINFAIHLATKKACLNCHWHTEVIQSNYLNYDVFLKEESENGGSTIVMFKSLYHFLIHPNNMPWDVK